MEFSSAYEKPADEIVGLFAASFSASEGPDEGELIGALVRNLMETTPDEDLFVFSAWQKGQLAGAIIFSRLSFPEDDRSVFILGPVAVATGRQGKGIGLALLTHGLNTLRRHGVDVAVTYGDPRYYAKVGFTPITEEVVRPPLALQRPEGWLAQSLASHALDDPLKGPSRCVEALNSQEYW